MHLGQSCFQSALTKLPETDNIKISNNKRIKNSNIKTGRTGSLSTEEEEAKNLLAVSLAHRAPLLEHAQPA